jgi:hypothetical protein
MQPGRFFCVNCHGRYLVGDAPNGLAGVSPVPSAGRGTAPPRTPHWPGGLNYGLRPPQGTVAETRGRQWFRCSQGEALCFNPPNGIHGAPAPNFGGRDSQRRQPSTPLLLRAATSPIPVALLATNSTPARTGAIRAAISCSPVGTGALRRERHHNRRAYYRRPAAYSSSQRSAPVLLEAPPPLGFTGLPVSPNPPHLVLNTLIP